MELIKEYTTKILTIIFLLLIALEISIFIYINKDSKNSYNKIFNNTLEKSAEKAKETIDMMNNFTRNLFMNYITKLKLITKQIILYNGKKESNNKSAINKNSKIFNNINLKEKILEAKADVINNKKAFQDIYNKTTEKFEYINYYIKKYGKDIDKFILLNKLLKECDELNYISYHNSSGDEFNVDNLNEDELKKLNFLIPIFKSIFLERFVIKNEKMDIIRIYILTPNELIIYPPEDATKIYLFNSDYEYYYCSFDIYYYACIYDRIIYNCKYNKDFAIMIHDYNDLNNLIYTICINFLNNNYEPIFCFEVNFGFIINDFNFLQTKKFDFGFALVKIVDYIDYRFDIVVYYNTNRKLNEIIEVFNSSEYTPEYLVIKDGKYNYYSLYYTLYLETTKILKQHPELGVNITDIEKEYENLFYDIVNLMSYRDEERKAEGKFNITTCRKKIINNEYECFLDEIKISVIMPFILKVHEINDDIVDTNKTRYIEFSDLIAFSITYTYPNKNGKDINLLIKIKLLRSILFYLLAIFILFCFYFLFINILSNYFFNSVNDLTKDMNKITLNEKTHKIILVKNERGFVANEEMIKLNNIYELLNISLIIKEIFENENFFKKYKYEINYLLDNINNKKIKEICNIFISNIYYNYKIFPLAEKEFKSSIIILKENEKELKIETKEEINKIKEEIKKSSNVPYLNEYSDFDNIDEYTKKIIYLNIYKQRIIYLYAMTKYKLAKEINKNNNIKEKQKRNSYINDAIKFFNECKSINKLLGINQIKINYTLIMISNCYVYLNDYKNSFANINEALNLYFRFSKTFNIHHSKKYNPKVMIFVKTNIFYHIIFTISNICSSFHKPCASNWIILKLFNTSPFILGSIHNTAGNDLVNFLEKNKTRMNRFDKNFLQNKNIMKEYDKLKKYYIKITSRLYSKKSQNNIKSNINPTIKENTISYKISSNLKTSKYKSVYNYKNK